MHNKNILFSTTRQWNPGDEFILFGVINLLKEIYGEFNSIIYNRNPEIRQDYGFLNPFRKMEISRRFGKKIEAFLRIGFWDNSFKDTTDDSFLDLVVFAGTPEWTSKRLRQLYEKINRHNIPCLYLGIGSASNISFNFLPDLYKKTILNSLFITVRDEVSYNTLKDAGAMLMPCPALFSAHADDEKSIESVNNIGLIFGTTRSVVYNKVDDKTFKFILKLYSELSKMDTIEIGIVCHYIDEVPEAVKIFPNAKIYYSFDAKDYVDIYKKFDMVIGHRVHGIGLAASLGIPGVGIIHDFRGGTMKGFLADIVSVNDDMNAIKDKISAQIATISAKNRELLSYKRRKKSEYLELLNQRLSSIDPDNRMTTNNKELMPVRP